ncbi:MAG: sigma-54 dependent transcriptional regulator [Candidatus Kapabacteria bacterium]|nr:sigma-54 dependent transcriptional regulator [Candidatus Kapabacteria bacterium]
MSKQNYTIVVIEDDPLVNSAIKGILFSKYTRVETFSDVNKVMEELHMIAPDLILLDIFLGDSNGLDILEQLRKQGYTMPVIIMTAFSDIKMAVRAMKLGAEDFIVKPLDLEQLEVSVDRSLKNFDLRRRVEILSEQIKKEQPSEILGSSQGMKDAMEMAKLISFAEDTTVLILGESGTGKELLSRFIHENSPRAKGPFVTINCGAIPRELAENELFGYERGAFTGATEKFRPGRFEQAQHGTILLDEIAELSLDLQVKLLRVLQERKFYRLGGVKEISVDVRVIASTNKDLESLVEQNKFREDLFYRLNVARMHLPPLRERGEDILKLATAFVQEFNKKFNKNVTGFTSEAADIINAYPWKGNVRELRNVIERIVLLEQGTILTKDSLGFLKSGTSIHINPSKNDITLLDGQHYLKISKSGVLLENVMKDIIEQTIQITNGNMIKAAKLLGISQAKLIYRIEQLGIDVS